MHLRPLVLSFLSINRSALLPPTRGGDVHGVTVRVPQLPGREAELPAARPEDGGGAHPVAAGYVTHARRGGEREARRTLHDFSSVNVAGR